MMDKKELKEDLIRDRIIESIQYMSDQWQYVALTLTLIILSISAYGFLSSQEADKFNLSSEISGIAQNEYNQGDVSFAIEDLENVLGDYENTHGGTQAYIYLIYDAYLNGDMSKLESLLEDYSIYSKDPLLESSILETRAYLSLSEANYSKAIDLLDQSLGINDIDAVNTRLKIAKARVYIASKEYNKAASLLDDLRDSEMGNVNQKNTIDELSSYLVHIDR
tara:strand:- start:636 stop:1301 length:666 start_codon:yes stop_codon:yes gene_type:complete